MDYDSRPRRMDELLLNATAPRTQLLFDGWLLRLARDDVKRASSVNVIGDSQMPLAEMIEHCEALYKRLGLPAIFRLADFTDTGQIDRALAQRGYAIVEPSLVQVCRLGEVPPAAIDGHRVTVPAIEQWVQEAGVLRGRTLPQIEAEWARLGGNPLHQHGLIAYDAEGAVACGLLVVEGAWAGLFDMFVAPRQRSRGLGTAVASTLLQYARAHGAEYGWLSVVADNASARAVYARLGFKPVYRYWYRCA